jgi:two-component system NarL family sensor kinase
LTNPAGGPEPRGREADPVPAMARLMTGQHPLAAVLAAAAGHFAEALRADGCLIYTVEDNDDLVMAAAHPPRTVDAKLRLRRGFGVTGRVAVDGIPVVLVDDRPRNPVHRELLGISADQPVSRLCVPARTPAGGCSAVVAVHSRTRRRFLPPEVALVQQLADLVGLRVELDRATSSLSRHRQDWEGLAAATVAAQETERRRLAGDLHDGVTQAIASLAFHLSAAELALDEGDLDYVTAQVRAAREVADLAFAETRSAISGLHSPVLEDLGLAAGLLSMARKVPNLAVDVDVEDLGLPGHVENALFRIAQEAVQNAAKHAQAERAGITLRRQGRSVVLRVSDDGRGFDAPGTASAPLPGRAAAQYGLTGMSERVQLIGGHLSVNSRPGAGCVVEVVIPDVPG